MTQRPEQYIMPDGQKYIIHKDRLFCLETGRYYRQGGFSRKQKRAFMRLKAGMERAVAKRERLCFLTLTTQYDKNAPQNRLKRERELNHAFTKLKQRIERYLQKATYLKLCKKRGLEPWEQHSKRKNSVKYPVLWKNCKFKFRYFKIKTSEGGGVLHICFRKAYWIPKIPYKWLSDNWREIWGAWNISISQIKIRNPSKVAMYLTGQYMAKQPILRVSYGQYWLGIGFRKTFNHLIEVYGYKRALEVWRKLLAHENLPTSWGTQKRLRRRKYGWGAQCAWHRYIEIERKAEFYRPKTAQTCVDSPFYCINMPIRYTIFTDRPWYRACKVNKTHEPIILSR